jgi:hypothetical protein
MGASAMRQLLISFGLICVIPILLAQCLFLARGRLGTLFYYSNILVDAAWKRLGFKRGFFEILVFTMGLTSLLLSGLFIEIEVFGLTCLLLFVLLKLHVRYAGRRILSTVHVRKDERRTRCSLRQDKVELTGSLPSPSPHPELIVNLTGPFIERYPQYNLGDLALGRRVVFKVIIANHSLIPCQALINLSIGHGQALELAAPAEIELQPLPSGGFQTVLFELKAAAVSGVGAISISMENGGQSQNIEILYTSIFDAAAATMTGAAISRYPGAARSAFAWRGDMDLYDTSTFQSIEGLAHTFSLAARYRFPQTMYLSTRLSLDETELKGFYEHFGVSRGQDCIGRFKAWVNENVELRHEIRYPFSFQKPYAIELGNHMHLHYGTDAAAAPENQWRLMAGIGAGVYPWMSGETGSFAEQRDNALMARRSMEQAFLFTPKSWAMPDSTRDDYTPAAVEAAGCEVTSDVDAGHRHNVLFQPPPHHPRGTRLAELTKRYPGDPRNITHYTMMLYWIHRAHRRALPVVFMSHQHLRRYEGHDCTRFTEAVMRYVLTRFNGDLHINTVYGVGKYWREVLSPTTRTVEVNCRKDSIELRNSGDFALHDVPLDLQFEGRRTATVLVDLPAGATVVVAVSGAVLKS